MASQNCIIVAVNHADTGTVTEGPDDTLFLDFTTGLYGQPGGSNPLPASNLQNPDVSIIWRSQTLDPAWTQIDTDLGASKPVDVVAVIKNNWSTSATWRVIVSNDPYFETNIYDSGAVNSWPSVGAGFGALPWGTFSWGDVISPVDSSFYQINAIMVLPTQAIGRYVRIMVNDPSNSAGYLEAGRLVIGPAYRPTINFQYGWSIEWVDNSPTTRSLGNKVFVDKRTRFRVLRMTLDHIPEAEMYANVFDFIDRRKGIAGDMLVVPRPDNPGFYIHEAIYARLQQPAPVVNAYFGRSTRQLVFEEIV